MLDPDGFETGRFSTLGGGKAKGWQQELEDTDPPPMVKAKAPFMGKNTRLLLGFVAGTIIFLLIVYALMGVIVYFRS